MNALGIIGDLAGRGVRIRIDGSDIELFGSSDIVTADLLARLHMNKPALMRSLIEIQAEAGDDWQEISGDPEKLRAFVDMLTIAAMRERAEVPPHYTATTVCRHCGPVPIFPGLPDKVAGCPWCANRLRSLPIPKAAS